jgi:long-chain acyl-CoA synthetase
MMQSTVDGKTISEIYLKRLQLTPDGIAYSSKRNGIYQPTHWRHVHSKILGIYHSYKKLGIEVGDRVAILSNTRPEWLIADLANLCAGVVTIPIYQSNTPEDVAYLIEHSESKLVFAEDESMIKKLEAAFSIKKFNIPVVSFSNPVSAINNVPPMTFEEFAAPIQNQTIEEEFKKVAETILPDNIASIVYTSGTTGQPKGVVLSHYNFLGELRAIIQNFTFTAEDTTLAFLPFAHILGRVESLLPLIAGTNLAFAENLNALPQNLTEAKPTVLVSVPRIYEKIYTKIQSEIAGQPKYTQAIFNWAVETGRKVARLKSELQPVPLALELKYKIADQLVFTKIREKFGGRIRLTVSGGAPLNPELCEFYHAAGIKIVEGYGLTETTAAITVNRPDDFSFGTVGKSLGNIELRLAADGEIQTRGDMVFREYYRNPGATAEVFTEDGWFCTGDIGEITQRGFLKITDRKKELIKTSGGKYIAPQKLENMLKGIRFISQAMVYGDREKYVVALITLNEGEAQKWASTKGLSFPSFEDLTKSQEISQLVESEISGVNKHLAHFETIKKFRILPRDFTIEAGELTPSLKLKRKVCSERYKDYIQSLY